MKNEKIPPYVLIKISLSCVQGFQSFMYTMLADSSHIAARLSVTAVIMEEMYKKVFLVRHNRYNNFVIPIYVVTACLYIMLQSNSFLGFNIIPSQWKTFASLPIIIICV